MIIEFAGLPGSGKTTATERLLAVAGECGYNSSQLQLSPFDSRSRIALGRAHCLARHPKMTAALLQGVARRKAPFRSNLFALRHSIVTACAMWHARAHEPSTGLIVAPEGIAQRAFMLFVDREGVADSSLVSRFLLGSPLPDVVIMLRAVPAVALSRVRQRDHGPLSQRFDGLSDSELEKRLGAGQRLLLDTLGDIQEARPALRVTVLDSTDLPAALRRISPSFIRQFAGEVARDSS